MFFLHQGYERGDRSKTVTHILEAEERPAMWNEDFIYWMSSIGYETEEELRQEEKIQGECPICKGFLITYVGDPLDMCSTCYHYYKNVGDKNLLIMDGGMYFDGGIKNGGNPKWGLGFGGSMWYYKRIGSEEVHKTNNMWHIGTIPDALKRRYPDQLSDTAISIPKPKEKQCSLKSS